MTIILIQGGLAAQESTPAIPAAALDFESEIQPILVEHCYDCHGDGASEGDFSFEQFETAADSAETTTGHPEAWWKVVKNLRARVMPPSDVSTMTDQERRKIADWVKFGPFQINPSDIDPGPVSARRLNRVEYGNTIRDLLGVRFNEKLLFPPDDSGHGFDNVANALTVSPMLLEKYLQAAELVIDRAVPKTTWIIPKQEFRGSDFRSTEPGREHETGRDMDGKTADQVRHTFSIGDSGTYRAEIQISQHGSFEFDPARYEVACSIDGQEKFSLQLGWDENKRTKFEYDEDWESGQHQITFRLNPIVPDPEDSEIMEENDGTHVRFRIDSFTIEGPKGTERREHPPNYRTFFSRDSPPADRDQRKAYTAEVLSNFTQLAFRGRNEPASVQRLVTIAESAYSHPDVSFEQGIARAMVAALVSPKFLFRTETTLPTNSESRFAPVDELSLASRLSYFLWSTMPDQQLIELAQAGKLREQLADQVDRMLADPKSKALVSNFVGQWLRTRDVVNVAVDPAVILGLAEEYDQLRTWARGEFRGRRRRNEISESERTRFARYREIGKIIQRFDDELKRSMQRETEMLVEHIVRNQTSLLDLLDCDYTFLNEKLAEHYGIPDVKGRNMRLVKLDPDSPRGGVLTHGSILLITSNPTRTSPVKRGLFVLDNLLGTPAPPAPGVVPELEDSADRFKDHEPSLRELLEAHRESDLCASCHARMDPIGFAMENFDALGVWRDQDRGAPIEPQGTLVSGESFDDIRSLKKQLRQNHASDFYRCVSEKLLVFALGRGLEFTDEHTVDLIVDRLNQSGGKFRTLVHAVVESAPFQNQRIPSVAIGDAVDKRR